MVRYFPWHMPVPIECSASTQEDVWVDSGGSCYPILRGSHATPADQALDDPPFPPLCPHPLAGVSRWGYASRVETTAGHEGRCSRKGDKRIRGDTHPWVSGGTQQAGCGSDSSRVFCACFVRLGTGGVCPRPLTLASRASCGCGVQVSRTGHIARTVTRRRRGRGH